MHAADAPIASNAVSSTSPKRASSSSASVPIGEREQVEQHEDDHRAQRALLDGDAVGRDRAHDLAVDGRVELALDELEQQQVADDLDRAAGRARGRADEHQQQERHHRQRAPLRVVRGPEPGRGHDRHRLEHARADRLLAAREVARQQLDDDQRRPEHEERAVEPQLLVRAHHLHLPLHEQAVQPQEVDPREDHEQQQQVLGERDERRGRLVLRREPAQGDHRQRVRDGLERGHRVVEPRPADESPARGSPPRSTRRRATTVAGRSRGSSSRSARSPSAPPARTAAAGGRRPAAAGARPRPAR